ncbi:MAG: hypothetical protein QNJ67_02170 [Kiloniellales bacterium]|nr:hypothetical protein [Kiloniellales bacterium]
MRIAFCLAALTTFALTSACTVSVHEDYPQYLVNNQGRVTLPQVNEPVRYYLSPQTEGHTYGIRSARAGFFMNRWVIDFGSIMDTTMRSADVRDAFDSVQKTATPYDQDGLLVAFDLTNYQFAGFEARVNLRIDVRDDGREIMSKTYAAKGRSQGGKIFWGGSFLMKNAVQQSTKNAVDKILKEFIQDMNQAVELARLDDSNLSRGGGSFGSDPYGDDRSAEDRTWRSPGGETIIWNDPDRGAANSEGSTTSLEYCREYQSMVTIDGRFEETYGTACRQPDGSWRIIE